MSQKHSSGDVDALVDEGVQSRRIRVKMSQTSSARLLASRFSRFRNLKKASTGSAPGGCLKSPK